MISTQNIRISVQFEFSSELIDHLKLLFFNEKCSEIDVFMYSVQEKYSLVA